MKAIGALGARIFRDAFRIDASTIEWTFALRSIAGVALAFAISYAIEMPAAGAALAIGAVSVGFASRQGLYRTRAFATVLTTLAMAVSTFAAALTASSVWASIAIAALWGYAYGIFASLGTTAATIMINSAVALAIFGQYRTTPGGALESAGFVVLGGLLQTILLVLLWPFERFPVERKLLSDGFDVLASYADHLATADLASPKTQAFADLTSAHGDIRPFAKPGEIMAFETLYDEIERLRRSLGAIAAERYTLARRPDDAAVRAIDASATIAAAVMREIAAALRDARAPDVGDAWTAFEAPMAALAASDDPIRRRVHDDLDAMMGQLRTSWRAAFVPAGTVPQSARAFSGQDARQVPRPRRRAEFAVALQTLRANLSPRSEYSRHGVRLAAVLALAVVAEHTLPLGRAYWIVLTATLVLRPDFGATISRAIARIGGTLAGAIVASAVALLHPHAIGLLGFALAFAFCSFLTIAVNYALFTTFITGFVVFLLAYSGTSAPQTLEDRVVATAIGGMLALCAYIVWPTWERGILPGRLGDLYDSLARYARRIFDAYLAPIEREADDVALHTAQRDTWLARSNAEVSFDRMASEPVKPSAVSVRTALGILAASRRAGVALLSLNAHRPNAAIGERAAFAALANAICTTFASLATNVRHHEAPGDVPPLRALHRAFAESESGDRTAAVAVAIAETDIVVDALNATARLLERAHAARPSSSDARASRSEERAPDFRT